MDVDNVFQKKSLFKSGSAIHNDRLPCKPTALGLIA
ncbi:hypothetical protein HP10700_03744 [Helicobacter pylori 10700]|nr:hypothetical protein HPYSS1_03434 [Helicobacter pylori SS1]KAF0999831.1 hypothetical protein HP10700_03744 [Helicobacter pylori 10700]